MSGLAMWRIVALMAFRDLGAHRVKSLVVGVLMVFGTFLVVSGSALLESVQASMEKSITSSLAGHMQVYSADAEDDLALFGGGGMGSMDYGEIDRFAPVREALADVPNVAEVVPMGLTSATVFGRTEIDRINEKLRAAVNAGDLDAQRILVDHLRLVTTSLKADVENQGLISDDPDRVASELAAIDQVQSDGFWDRLQAEPEATLEFLDTEVAPVSADGRLFYMRCIGTDLHQFAEGFDRFHIVEGENIPEGKRGILFSRRFYETFVKNRVAHELDDIRQDLVDSGGAIADDQTLQNRIASNARQYQRILFQIPPADAPEMASELRGVLGRPEDDTASLGELLQEFLRFDDSNFELRYAWFYDHIAPRIQLYEMPVGDVITLRGFTKTGYLRAVNVKVYGTFDFDGLERSDLAGANQLVDLITFRQLYGKMTQEQRAELDEIRASVGVEEVDRADAEDALFGGPAPAATVETEPLPTEALPAEAADGAPEGRTPAFSDSGDLTLEVVKDALDDHTYTTSEMTDGLALNAAVLLKDPKKLRQSMADVQAALDAAGLGLKVVDWKTASGIVGQLIMVLQGVLYISILVVFLVTIVIINNTMVTTTMDRTTEIGTMRAIGAQRKFVVVLFLLETLLLGLISGAFGSALALGFIGWLGHVGIPAVEDILVLFFAGPRLYPAVSSGNLLFGVVVVTFISLLSTLYPALLAARVQPVVAMQGKE